MAIRFGAHPSPTLPVQGERTITKKYSCGFTLAEVLITLVIVGIIAAITVPTLITKYQKEQTVTRLKKVYSSLSQTTARAIADNGPIETWELGIVYNSDAAKTFFNKYMKPYLNISTPLTTSSEGGWETEYLWLNNDIKNHPNYSVRTYLNDGSSLTFRILHNNDTSKQIYFNIDINGDQKPNKMGKDNFQYYYDLISGKFVPTGVNKTREELLENCNKQDSGVRCTALIMKDGWRIADDYPW